MHDGAFSLASDSVPTRPDATALRKLYPGDIDPVLCPGIIPK